jgi:hypothetical protein
MRSSRFLDDGGQLVHVAGGEVAQAFLHARPDAGAWTWPFTIVELAW